jgi:hypothetical protein
MRAASISEWPLRQRESAIIKVESVNIPEYRVRGSRAKLKIAQSVTPVC